MFLKKYTLLILLCFFSISLVSQVHLNEYSASNLSSYVDNFLKTEDWIELYNSSDEPIDLGGWFLSDKEDKPEKWEIPAGVIIPAKGHVIFWCSGRDVVLGSQNHTNFKLSQTKSGEFVVLTQADGTIVESVPLGLTLLANSHARSVDGTGDWMICTEPSFRSSNNDSPKYRAYAEQATMDLSAGFYQHPQAVSLAAPDSNLVIHYTTDGTTPTETSPIYDGELINISETMVVKARTFSTDSLTLPSKVTFNTYFINEDFTLDVYSIAADEVQDLANGQGELRPIGSIEYFNKDKERVSISYGDLNRHGQDSWVNPHRSIDWVSRDEMGYTKEVTGKLFNYSDRDTYQRLMFRASGDDNYPAINDYAHEGSTHIRDEYVHTLAQDGDLKLDIRAVERVIVFLNGDYWGVYGLRERPVDHDYTKEYYDQEKYDLQYLLTWGTSWAEYGGDEAFDDWAVLRDFILDNDMSSDTNYEYVKSQMQVLGLIDYMIINLAAVSSDWLNYNTGWWRGINPDGDHKKWGYILWDNDATFDYYINYSGVPNINPDAEPCDINEISDYMDYFFGDYFYDDDEGKHEKIFLKLQAENDEFRQLYYSRQADLVNTVFSCDNMLTTLDSMLAIIEPEMPRQIERWGGSMTEWKGNVERLKNFINDRCQFMAEGTGMKDCFDLEGPYPLVLEVAPAGAGEIELNTLEIEDFPWTGSYFGNMENKIKAKSKDDDLVFLYWESKNGNEITPSLMDRDAAILLTTADTLVAVFGIPTATYEVDEDLTFEVNPNPAQDHLNLTYNLEESTNVSVALYSVLGEQITTFPSASGQRTLGTHTEQLDLYDVPSGLYFLSIKTAKGEQTVKITVVD